MAGLCITVDLDRDANIPIPGSREAGSSDRGEGTSPRFLSSHRGLGLLADLFDDLGVPATFFAECQTLEKLSDSIGCLDGFEVGVHGYAHEDFSLLDPDTAGRILGDSCEMFRDLLGTSPSVFRAPYMKAARQLLDILPGYGFRVDSSLYSPAESCRPYPISERLTELPVLRDPGTGRTSYLWPAYEGRRDFRSYAELAESVGREGTFVLCDHSWHICESHENGMRSEEEVAHLLSELRSLLCTLLDSGFEPVTVSEAASL